MDWPAKKKISKHVNEIWNSYHHPTGIWLGTNMATEESQCYINKNIFVCGMGGGCGRGGCIRSCESLTEIVCI